MLIPWRVLQIGCSSDIVEGIQEFRNDDNSSQAKPTKSISFLLILKMGAPQQNETRYLSKMADMLLLPKQSTSLMKGKAIVFAKPKAEPS